MTRRRAELPKTAAESGETQSPTSLRQGIIEGSQEMAQVYLEIEREFHPLEEEAHRLVESQICRTWQALEDPARTDEFP